MDFKNCTLSYLTFIPSQWLIVNTLNLMEVGTSHWKRSDHMVEIKLSITKRQNLFSTRVIKTD